MEAMIAFFLTTIAVVSVLSMQPTAWRAAGKADYLGRAAGVMQSELELRENQIMLGNIPTPPPNQTVTASGGTNAGDATFNLTTTITNPSTNSYLVKVNVAWKGNCAGGTCNIASSMLVTPQSGF